MGKLQYLVVQENPAPVAQGRKISLGTAQISAALEAAIYAAWPTEIVVPPVAPPPPAPPPPPPNAVLVAKGDGLMAKANTLRAGQALLLERGGVWNEPLALRSGLNGCSVGNYGTGPLPRIVAQFGLMLYGPTDGLLVSGVSFQGTPATDGYGIQGLTQGIRNAKFTGLIIQGFRMGVMFQHPRGAAAAPFGQWHGNLSFRNNLILDSQGSGERDGQGMYLETVDGLDVTENLIDGAGMNRRHTDGTPDYNIYTHGMYIQAGNKRVNVVRNIVSRAESFGIQTRGPDINAPGQDTADPGPVVDNNVLIDCAIGFAVDAGSKGHATGNYFVPGHFHGPQYHHGQGCAILHVGSGDYSNNTRFDGPPPDGKKLDWRMPFIDLSVDSTDSTHPWRWTGPVAGNIQGRDYLGKGVTVNLSAYVAALRANAATGISFNVGAIRDLMAAACEGVITSPNRLT